MSCCPPAPELVAAESADADYPSQDTEILPGESVECYMKRAENPSGLKDDLTDNPVNKIANTSIPVSAKGEVSVAFTLTNSSGNQPPQEGQEPPPAPRTASSWAVSGNPSWLTLNGNTLTGTAPAAEQGKSVTVKITASDGAGEIDSRSYTFAPPVEGKEDVIQLVHPLPGQPCSSKFGPRVHPIRKVNAPHKGCDFNTPGAKLTNVLAAADGTVTYAGNQGAAGNMLKIDHYGSSGALLCQTVYMHLSQFYVQPGQKVAAGQKVALEGNTGGSTGPHLHFEVRLIKNGQTTWVDPLPLIRGEVKASDLTAPDNTPGGPVTTQVSNAVLSASDVAAKTAGCEPFSPDYPGPTTTPPGTDPPPPPEVPPNQNPFQYAWYYTMKHEVGPHWDTATQYAPPPPDGHFPPGDPDVIAGSKETTAQRKQTGYVNRPGYPGGETKFGIAQGPNPKISVGAITYENSRRTGFTNYWQAGGSKGPSAYEASKPKTAIMLFDMYYLHGGGNVRGSILPRANVDSLADDDACRSLSASQKQFLQGVVTANPSRSIYLKGWLKRSDELLAYALAYKP